MKIQLLTIFFSDEALQRPPEDAQGLPALQMQRVRQSLLPSDQPR